MRLLWCLYIEEKESRICGLGIPNRPLAAVFALAQLSVACASLYQHIFSIYKHKHVFLCKSKIDYETADFETKFLAYDIIIFDIGLMRRVLGTEECVANYLDGGYMRFAWCAQHVFALSLALVSLMFFSRPIWLLWPALLVQSSYSLGLSVLTMATAPKMLEALGGYVSFNLASSLTIYIMGFVLNWLFTFILWHHYWYIERKLEARKRHEKELEKELVGEIIAGDYDDEEEYEPEFV